jgi:hypothetical protein
MFYPAQLVMPGASRFDQLLNLTTRLVDTTASRDPDPTTKKLYTECLQKLKDFLLEDSPNAPALSTPHVPIPVVEPTRHRPSTDIGLDLVGFTFTDRALGRCTVLAPSTYTDSDNIIWNTLDFTASKHTKQDQFAKASEVRKWIKLDKIHTAPSRLITPTSNTSQILT